MLESYQNAITARPGGFVEGVGVHVRAQDAIASESEHGGQVVARAQIAAADGDALQNRIDQGKFVRSDGQAHQDERAVAAQQSEGLRDGSWRGREDNRGIHVAQRAGIRAGGAGEGQLFFRGIGNRRAQSLVERDLERQVAEAAVAEEGHRLAGGEGSFAERSVGVPTGAAERRSIGGGKMGGNTDQSGGWRQRVVAERASRLRQDIRALLADYRQRLENLLPPRQLLKGSFYELKPRCGKPSCHCASPQGPLHASPVLSWSERGKTRLRTLPAGDTTHLRHLAEKYRRFRQDRAALVKLHNQILVAIGRLQRALLLPPPKPAAKRKS